ncbi:hypothetical protein C8P68_104252 [Mucilaginibacter yixingensis]|uniref:WD40 repeat protein n=1 Tax=Mucilaginibacter yixingensis TaxID=1295612 RepID=A0A2T5J9K9_9SPHI|nr:hypothetical protein [Mucilaginibacter yixingensis]PTQ96763.1 hypothetical protein C8P68_104252 [Mucilaginibacter yixingensis]
MNKKSPLNYILLSALCMCGIFSKAQAQEFGGNPPSIKWNQVNTPQTRVIFPQGMDSAGRRVASIIARMNGVIQPTLGSRQKQVNVVLQNQTTFSNAYVGLAPFRSEFYLTPDQNSFEVGSLRWTDQLAIHEYRHVQQFNNFDVGVSRVLHIIFGESGQALANELSVPNWFFEGDAVFNETLVSQQGRGRLPYFFNGYRALWAADKNYSYQKLRNGSFLDYTPDHYPLGYMLVSYGRQQYGSTFWKGVTHNAAAYTYGLNPFQNAFKHAAKTDFMSFEQQAQHYYKQQFNDKPLTGYKKNQHFIANIEYPAFTEDGAMIYMKSTYNHLPVFVWKKGNVERVIKVRDMSLDSYFAYNNGKIVYAAYQPDARWGYRDYSEICVVDVKTGKETRLTHRTKYFSPDFSADGKSIVTVQQTADGKYAIHLLNAENGQLVAVVPNPQNLYFTYPKFYNNDQLVSAVRQPGGQMSIALVDIKSGKLEELTTRTEAPIGFTSVKGDTILFSATSGNRDKLYAITSKSRLYELSNDSLQAGIGNYQPALSKDKLAWVSFTAYGYQMHKVDKASVKWMPAGDTTSLSNFGIKVLQADSATNLLAKVNTQPLPVTKYNKAHGLFNFHSLIPSFNDPEYTISLEGENILNTFQSSLDFTYNRDEGYKQFGFSGIYGALFPYLQGGVDYTIDRKGYNSRTGGNVYWNETELFAGATVPLTFTNGTQITSLSFGSNIVYNSTSFQQAYRSQFADRSYTYLSNSFSVSHRIQKAKQNIYPRFAQSLLVQYKVAVSNISANQFLASGSLYLPGLSVNHNLVISGAFQQNGKENVISFSNGFPYSRGYTAENLYQLKKIGANYHFPIAYPDGGIGNTVYFQRIRGNLFFDYTRANDFYTNGRPFQANFRSTGAEIYFDTKWFNQTAITFGLRYSHLLDNDLFGTSNNRDRIELIVPLTLF